MPIHISISIYICICRSIYFILFFYFLLPYSWENANNHDNKGPGKKELFDVFMKSFHTTIQKQQLNQQQPLNTPL